MDEFEVLDLIGEGSFGRVFKARQRLAPFRTVALKLIPKVAKSEREISALRMELKIQKSLSAHPNIVRMMDAFETKNELVAVTEYVPGELHRLFDHYKVKGKQRGLPEERVRELAVDVLSALHHLHQNRILHRDVKPQNVLIDPDGRAKLCDFGFARSLGSETLVLTSVKGTPLYMAPEVMEGKPYDQSVDLWSVGCILYELCTGQTPFATNDLTALISKVRYDCISWPQDMGEECKSFLQGLLEKDCKKRMSWQQVLKHPFVAEAFGKNLTVAKTSSGKFASLTEPMSESQELAKEIQRQDKAKKLMSEGGQPLIKLAKKCEEERKQLLWQQQRIPGHHDRRRRCSDTAMMTSVNKFLQQRQQQQQLILHHHARRRHSESGRQHYGVDQLKPIPNLASRTELLALSQRDKMQEEESLLPAPEDNRTISARMSKLALTEKAHRDVDDDTSVTAEDTSFDSDEWCQFLDSQLEEVSECVTTLDNQNYLSMLAAPLRSSIASPAAVSKVCAVLMLPFVLDAVTSDQMESVLNGFVATRMVTQLISSLKMLLKREGFDDRDQGVTRVALVLNRLVHTRECFAVEMNDQLDKDLVRQVLGITADNALSWLIRTVSLEGKTEFLVDVITAEETIRLMESGHINRRKICVLLCLWKKFRAFSPSLGDILSHDRVTEILNSQIVQESLPEKVTVAVKRLCEPF